MIQSGTLGKLEQTEQIMERFRIGFEAQGSDEFEWSWLHTHTHIYNSIGLYDRRVLIKSPSRTI